MITDSDLKHLERCVELARIALEKGDQPFGSVLVGYFLYLRAYLYSLTQGLLLQSQNVFY